MSTSDIHRPSTSTLNIYHLRSAQALLNYIVLDDDLLKAKVHTLTAISRSRSSLASGWADGDLMTMGDRLQSLQASTQPKGMGETNDYQSEGFRNSVAKERLPDGWRRVDPKQWRHCHFGGFISA